MSGAYLLPKSLQLWLRVATSAALLPPAILLNEIVLTSIQPILIPSNSYALDWVPLLFLH
jgi:hypothetical protein